MDQKINFSIFNDLTKNKLMKNLTFSLFAGITLALASCGGPSIEDVNVAELKDACECSDAVETVSDIVVHELGKYDNDMKKLEENAESKTLVKSGKEKIDDIISTCQKDLNVSKADIEKCSSYKDADENMKMIKKS